MTYLQTPLPTPFQLNVQVNADFVFTGQWLNPNNGNAPIPLTGAKMSGAFVSNTDVTKNFQFSTANNMITITDAPNGIFTVLIPAIATQKIPIPYSTKMDPTNTYWIGNGTYNISVTVGGSTTLLMTGPVAILQPLAAIPQ